MQRHDEQPSHLPWRRSPTRSQNGVFYGMRAQLPAVAAADGGGAIVNIASILGSVGFVNAAAYVSAKHAIVGLSMNAALEYAADEVAALVVFLASDAASFITGGYYVVDGGYTAQ